MKILGRSVSNHFQSFREDIAVRLGIPIKFKKNPLNALGDYNVKNDAARIRLNIDMARPNFEHNAAHELLYALQDKERWPRTFRRVNLNEESWEAGVGSELAALVLDLDVEERLQKVGF